MQKGLRNVLRISHLLSCWIHISMCQSEAPLSPTIAQNPQRPVSVLCKAARLASNWPYWNIFSQRFPNLISYFVWVENSHIVGWVLHTQPLFKRAISIILWFKTTMSLIFTSGGIKYRRHDQALASLPGLGQSPSPETFIPPLNRPSLWTAPASLICPHSSFTSPETVCKSACFFKPQPQG